MRREIKRKGVMVREESVNRTRIAEGLSRRSLLGRSAAATGGAVLSTAALAGTVATSAARASPVRAFRLFPDPAMDFGVSFALGETAYGAGEAGEILATVNAINRASAELPDVLRSFHRHGRQGWRYRAPRVVRRK